MSSSLAETMRFCVVIQRRQEQEVYPETIVHITLTIRIKLTTSYLKERVSYFHTKITFSVLTHAS